jgi:hypothetical protein
MIGRRMSNRDPLWVWALLDVSAFGFAGPIVYDTVPYLLRRNVLKQWPGMDSLDTMEA